MVLAPADAAGGVEVLLDKVAALLEVVDAFDAVAPPELLPQDLRLLDVDPLLPHNVLPHFQHRHRILVRIRGIEVIRCRLIEFHSLLSAHFLRSSSLPFAFFYFYLPLPPPVVNVTNLCCVGFCSEFRACSHFSGPIPAHL
jgi:hypothetical protein